MNALKTLSKKELSKKIPTKREVSNALCYVSLKHFTVKMWSVVEPVPFMDGMHIECICDHLEAVSRGDIRRLIINIPPRHSKSLLVSVMWPMWHWLHNPAEQWLFSSYAHNLSMRDSVKSRRIFQSNAYQELLMEYQPDLVLVGDQNTKIKFENSENGYRLATSVDGANTGEGGGIVVVDDANNIKDGESVTKRTAVNLWWDEVMPTRLNDPKTGAFVIIMQRSHEDDLSGHILAREAEDWVHVCLPARYEGENRIRTTLMNWDDPRTKEDEPLCPERFGDTELKALEKSLGTFGTAGQLQQRPAPRGGGMMKVANMSIISAINRRNIVKSIRYWDKAGTEGGGARTAGVLMHLLKDDSFVIEDVVKGQWEYAEREKRIRQTALLDCDSRFDGEPGRFEVWTEQEPGSGGKESADRTVKNSLRGFSGHKETATGDKAVRAQPLSAAIEAGSVSLLAGPWVEEYIKELEKFPAGKFKDQTDGSSGAFNKLNGFGDTTKEKTGGIFGKRRNVKSNIKQRRRR